MKRVSNPEILDGPDLDPREVELSLADLRTVNRFFGGTSTSNALFRKVVADRKLHEFAVLDIGSGSGDVPLSVARRMHRERRTMSITFLDQHANHLPVLDPDNPLLHNIIGDALNLPFADNSFDIVSCSLLLHHLEPAEATRFAREALRVARHAVIINDLIRNRLHHSLLHLWRPFFRTRVSYLDGLTSVRRAYTPNEIRQMFKAAGRVEITRHYLFRMGIILWK